MSAMRPTAQAEGPRLRVRKRMRHVAGLILAAGASRRMGTPKALLRIGGETLLDRQIRLFTTICNPIVVVLGHDSDRILAAAIAQDTVTLTINPDPDRGMLSSLQCGLTQLPPEATAVLFTPVDYAEFQAGTLAQIAASFRSH